ncbi:MAG: hypothetical protein Q4B78_04810, partial [Bacillota bacterium]|nr:hypothetical protein [Bacillota bacterium]
AIAEALDEKSLNETRDNLFNIRRRLEDIIYNTNLSIDPNTDPQKLAKINNIILELEKSSINLGSALSDKASLGGIDLTEEEIAKVKEAKAEEKAGFKTEKKIHKSEH